jgi:organic hydroperoxide reductase OsmC/OhrA
MLASLPHRYTATLRRTYGSRARIEGLRPPLATGTSPEIDANDASPEHMLLSCLGLGLLSTFERFAAREGIELLSWNSKTSGLVEDTPEGPMFTSVVLELDIEVDGNTERFDDALEDAKSCCVVQNALRVPVVIEANVRTPCIPAPIDDAPFKDAIERLRGQASPIAVLQVLV